MVEIYDAYGSGNGLRINNSGAALVKITDATVNVDVTVADYISVTPSGTFYVTSSGAGTYTVLGSVAITNSPFFTGSVNVATPVVILGSVALSPYAAWTGIGSTRADVLGSVAITTANLTVLGSTAITNTVPITNAQDEEGRRAPDFGFSGALLTTSGLTANVFTPATGSKSLLKWVSISTDVANYVSIKFSGQTTIPIVQFFIPASGTVIQNFIGGEPSGGANMPLSAGIGVAGNIYVSAGIRSVP